jgi:RNA polymerase sigma-70 factor (ECF subfamily)
MSNGNVVASRVFAWVQPVQEADWEALYAEQLPRVYNYFRYRVGHGAVAEDLTSITFEKAWRARHRYRRDLSAFTTWLLAVARNVAIDHYRQRRPHVSLEHAAEVAGGATPEELAERRSDVERLAALLASLPDRERELLSLKYGAGVTNRAIAKLTGLTESNVGTLLHRTIHDLRARWGGDPLGVDDVPSPGRAGTRKE